MKNLLILYNPYYQKDVIQQHLSVLIEKEKVAFGKVRSKLKDMEHCFLEQLQECYASTSPGSPLQLFLTDYASLFVAKVTRVTTEDMSCIAPTYYKEKNLEVEVWFVIEDMRELVRSDFELLRDEHLANFTTPNFGDHTYAIYGNRYVYPLIVQMKEKRSYFETKTKYYPDVFKSKEFLHIKNNLMRYTFGEKYIHSMHPDSMDNIISAEMEFEQNKENPLYDFSSVVVKYSKTLEQEIYLFMKKLVAFLSTKDKSILGLAYSVQGREYVLEDIFSHKPNLGTYKYLLKTPSLQRLVERHCFGSLKFFVLRSIPFFITTMQNIRNETVHGEAPAFKDVEALRGHIVGVATQSMVVELVKERLGIVSI